MTAKEMLADMGYRFSGVSEHGIWFEKRQENGSVQSRVVYAQQSHGFRLYEDYGCGLELCGVEDRMVRAMAKLLDEMEKPSGWVPFTEDHNNDL